MKTLVNNINQLFMSILVNSTRIPTRGPVGVYTSCHGDTLVMINCTIFHQLLALHATNSNTMTTCNRKYINIMITFYSAENAILGTENYCQFKPTGTYRL